MKQLIQFKISLNESLPLVWRQVLVHKDTTFFELHHIIQITMGWQNYHMFEYNVKGYRIGTIDEGDRVEGFGSDSLLESRITQLCDIVSEVGDIIKYEYDFGDGWQHTLEVQGFLDATTKDFYPICLAGEMACPPEDCGGLSGFYNNLEILKDKKHPEYKELKMWMPRGYNTNKFNLEKVNKQLGTLERYIAKWLRG